MTGATPAPYRDRACCSRASKIDDGTPLYCADPSTTIASEGGCESCRAVHQIAVAVETTSRTTASTRAPTTRPTRLPARTPTRHGYHARLSVRSRCAGCAGPLREICTLAAIRALM